MRTRTIRRGSLVSCVSYRSPVLLACMAADVDRMSHGRLVLGVGIGDVAMVDMIPPAALAVVRTSLMAGTPEAVLSHYRALAEAGMQYLIARLLPDDTETLRLLAARIIPAMTSA